ncbi:hypothetical protein FRC10_002991 [Ceratobasidium sp. 414]|nr:hypothetical protein FRC10_002991 [Ceratobasidium sp. 414]
MIFIKAITLDPATSTYDVAIALLVDDVTAHKLQRVQKGETLHWVDLNVHESSTLTVRITEKHKIRDQTEPHAYQISQIMGQDSLSIGRGGGKYGVKLEFLGGEAAEQAYRGAFARVQQMEIQPSMVERTRKAGTAFKALLTLGSTMAELDPSGGAKAAFAVCAKAWELLKEQDKQNKDLNQLVEDLARMIPSAESVRRLANANLEETVTDMLNLIEDVSLLVMRFYSRRSRTQMFTLSIFDSSVQDQMQEFVTKFKSLREEFDTRVVAQTLETVQVLDTIQATGAAQAVEITRISEAMQTLDIIQELDTAQSAKVTQVLETTQAEMIRSRLKPVDQAGYDPTRACIPGTRVDVIHDITRWIEKSNRDQRLAWVYGLGGLGKSTIAASVCKQLDERGMLSASFFCKRDSPELRDPHRVLTSIAYRLAMRWKPYGEAVVAVVKADPEVCSQHIQPLCDVLLLEPLQAVEGPDHAFTIVIDALDECGGIDSRNQLITCLQKISRSTSWLQLVVTSRPDADIQECFAQLGSDWYTPYNVLSYDALADIRVFIRGRLCNLERDVEDWPKDAVNRLSERSSGLFIWARTACDFILQGHNPCRRLEQVLVGGRVGDSSAELDKLYAIAVKTGAADEDEDELADVLQCLGIVVATATRTPLPMSSLVGLLRGKMSPYTVDHVVRRLASVLYLDPNQDDAIRVSHPSFMDYITDRSRSRELCVDLDKQNALLAECCLQTMTKELRFNLCNLESSHWFNQRAEYLDVRVRNAIRPHLSYSCAYWTSHLVVSGKEALDRPLRTFLFGLELLYWIEASSLLGKLSAALLSLTELSRAPNIAGDCRAYAHDVFRFLITSYDAVSKSTPHLYVSALGLAPSKSEMVQHIRHHFPNTFTIMDSAEQKWSPCLRTIQTGSLILATTFSPDGRYIATGSLGGTVGVWDAESGDALLETPTSRNWRQDNWGL